MKSIFAAITNASVRFRWLTVLIVVAFLGLGVYSASKMRQELLPPIDFPQVFIFTLHPGTSSEDLRDLVSIPLEKAVTAIPGVLKAGLQSTTVSPLAFVSVSYEYGINTRAIQDKIQAAIDSVINAGVPRNLATTDDLTPDIVKHVLGVAPSMFKHFDSAQLLAMPPEVLDAALSVNPDFAAGLDPLTRDQLAAERVNLQITKQKSLHKAVALPSAWVVTDDVVPKIKTFSLNSLPVVTASVAAKSSDLTPDQLRTLVNDQLVKPITQPGTGIAAASVSGGEQIPADVQQEANAAVARAQAQAAATAAPTEAAAAATAKATAQATAAATVAAPATSATPVTPSTSASGGTAPPSSGPAATPVQAPLALDPNGVPLPPPSWLTALSVPLFNSVLNVPINTLDDLFKTTDDSGKVQSAAAALNVLAAKKLGSYMRDLTPAMMTYLKGKESTVGDNMTVVALGALTEDAYVAIKGGSPAPALGNAWTSLANQTAFKSAHLTTVRDLLALPGGAAATLNAIVASTPPALSSFAVRIASSITPNGIKYLIAHEDGFLSTLSPAVLRDLSADSLSALPSAFISAMSDKQLKSDLQAIIDDPSKAAAAQLKDASSADIPDDPQAPKLPASWPKALSGRGIKAVKADDLLRHPSGQATAAAFVNLLANFGAGNLIGDLTPDVLTYLQQHEKDFYAKLQATTIGLFSKATLAKLPPDVAGRAESATVYTPTQAVTRVNGNQSLIVSITKDDSANTVEAADKIQVLFDETMRKNQNILITVSFEQASFIKDSISGVAREGVLGAVMAVIVILIFLNFSFRSTLVTAVSIPTSVAIAFVLMYELPRRVHPLLAGLPDGAITAFLLRLFPANITLNIMTLSGLTVAIGRVVDDSIVVLENIYTQVQKGVAPKDAVLRGTRDVSLAIFAATVTTVVVFLPIGLTGGIIGEIFLPFGLAVSYALMASFIVAITIVPLLAYWFVRQKPGEHTLEEGRMEKVYVPIITWALDRRWLVMGLAGLSLVFGVYLFGTRPTTFLPGFGQPQISASISMPPGTTLPMTNAYTQQFEKYLDTLVGHGLDKYTTTVGSSGGFASFVGSGVTANAAQVTMAPTSLDADSLAALVLKIRGQAESIFGQKNVKVSKGTLTDQGFGGFALVASGPETELEDNNETIIKALSAVPGLANVSSTLSQVAGAGTTYLRIAQQPAVQFSAELETQDTLGVTAKAIAAIKALPGLPTDLTIGQGFQSAQQTQGVSQTFGSLGIAILIVYLVMVFTFGSPIQPFTILFSLPLAVVGAALGLAITNRVVGISALIGMLMLIGIVVTNAIVLIDRVQTYRKAGMPVRQALIEGGRTRLRPILMTAIATMIALLPLASGLSEGAIIASELGTVVIGGLFSSTILTLIAVPVVYSLLDQAQRTVLRRPAETAMKPAIAPAVDGD